MLNNYERAVELIKSRKDLLYFDFYPCSKKVIDKAQSLLSVKIQKGKSIGKTELWRPKMDKNRCDRLIKKAFALHPSKKGTIEDLLHLESALNVKIPEDFSYLWGKYNYQYVYSFDCLEFPIDVEKNTKFFREKGLPEKYIILYEKGDAGSIFMETSNDPETPAPVYWCDMEDVYNLCEEGVFKYHPTAWDSFTDFFEYLVNEEEKCQLEDGKLKAPISLEKHPTQGELF